jgi:5'/3'-nucleotidase
LAVWVLGITLPSAQQRRSTAFTILLSNDDGYNAPGLAALADALKDIARVRVAAPATEQSGIGHALILRAPISLTEHQQPDGATWYAIEGPPATCVRLAVESLLDKRPDLVISGINRGDNLGTTVYHSGTLAAAREAALVGIPALAISLRRDDRRDYAAGAAYVRHLVEQLRAKQLLRPGLFVNVNFPAGTPKGVRVTNLSMTPRPERFDGRTSPPGRRYFWPVWEQLKDDRQGTDVWALVRGYITLTPMILDTSATAADLKSLSSLEHDGTVHRCGEKWHSPFSHVRPAEPTEKRLAATRVVLFSRACFGTAAARAWTIAAEGVLGDCQCRLQSTWSLTRSLAVLELAA